MAGAGSRPAAAASKAGRTPLPPVARCCQRLHHACTVNRRKTVPPIANPGFHSTSDSSRWSSSPAPELTPKVADRQEKRIRRSPAAPGGNDLIAAGVQGRKRPPSRSRARSARNAWSERWWCQAATAMAPLAAPLGTKK